MAVSVAGIIVDDDKILIARRLPGGDLGGKWEFPGGKAEEGETDTQTLIREFYEEFSVTVKIGPLLGESSFEHHGITRTLRAYRVYLPPEPLKLNEHSEWRFAALAEIETLDFAPSDLKLLPFLKKQGIVLSL
ncbi:DNA mismatch repair protein MutT [Spirochaetia bacterium]|nr:DNA mismatch repair protein MutT [Spirochaetia bacterium]